MMGRHIRAITAFLSGFGTMTSILYFAQEDYLLGVAAAALSTALFMHAWSR